MSATTLHDWHRVTRAHPCEVCGRPDWCGRSDDGLIRCMRGGDVPPGYRFIRENPDGGRLYGPVDDRAPRPAPPPRPSKPKPSIDWAARHAEARARVIPGELADFADAEMNLSGESLDLLAVGVDDDPGSGWLFPERDGWGNVIGITRRLPDGNKLALKHSRRGLTYQYPLPPTDPVLVAEGASDTAAAIEAGFTVVGRPSASGGADLLAVLLRGREVIVFGENDQKDDGTWPGREGAERIADRLRPVCRSVRVVFPPEGAKDLRSWLIGGAA